MQTQIRHAITSDRRDLATGRSVFRNVCGAEGPRFCFCNLFYSLVLSPRACWALAAQWSVGSKPWKPRLALPFSSGQVQNILRLF